MSLLPTRFRSGGLFRSFQSRIILVFSLILAITLVSQVFYKSSIDSMHEALISAVGTAEIIHAAENFHSAAHSMLVLATGGSSADRAHAHPDYVKHREVAMDMLVNLLSMTDEGRTDKPSANSSRLMVMEMSVTFSRFSAVTDSLIVAERSSGYEEQARTLFDAIFDTYIELLHQYHNDRLEGLKNNAHMIDRGSTIMFVFQLSLIIIAVILVAIFSVRALVRPYKRAEQYALSDGLTGLRNRRYLETFARPEMADMIDKGAPFSISLMDIDKFKNLNDTYGHQSGDQVLVEMARILVSGLRESDSVVRFGGEEFLVFLPGANKENAMHILEKIRASIEEFPFYLNDRKEKVRVTASFGLAAYPDDTGDVQKLISVADERLYQAKNAGRNRIQA